MNTETKYQIAKHSNGKLLYATFPKSLLSWVEDREIADEFNLDNAKSLVNAIRDNYMDEEILLVLKY